MLREMFAESNYLVVEASNGKEAIEAASDESPDIIVIDVNMPIMDGLTASKLIRKLGGRYQKIPIIALSVDGPEMRDQAIRAGCSHYFGKNEIDRLISTIEQILMNP